MLKQSRATKRKIAPFEDIRTSLRDAVCFWRFQTRAEARAYVRSPLSRQGQIGNRKGVTLEARAYLQLPLSRQGQIGNRKGVRLEAPVLLRLPLSRQEHSTMRQIPPLEDIRASLHDAVCFWRFQTRAEARAYVRSPLSRQGQIGNRKGVRLEARAYLQLPLSRQGRSTLDCRYCGRSGSRRKSSVAVLMDEIQHP
jgi:hypothetical protein